MSTQPSTSSVQVSKMQTTAPTLALATSSSATTTTQKATSSSKSEQGPCRICFDEIDLAQEIITKCAHHFHIDCLNKWLTTKNTCPLCRTTGPLQADEDPLLTNSDQNSNSQIKADYILPFHAHVIQVAIRVFSSTINSTTGSSHL